ncbi:uncharacterized protein LOC119884158 isoform X2 [Micropterus salmoides]|uniref:uncharacterized protein LOC119884158 isoform X2 n=2 Tax=Micropterus salmoides TaxID=27706 RepID=UPI0018EAD0C2|nr:uncharacterized protein LOC119884158 isoform X2 [Micropterus salmoides]
MSNRNKYTTVLKDHKMKTHNQAHADQRVTLRWTVFVFMTMILWKKCADRPELNQTRTPKQPAKETAKYSHWQSLDNFDNIDYLDILLLNLTVSDLIFLIILPLKMHEAASGMKWNLPEFLCSITAFTFFSTIYTSSLLLMAMPQ